MSVKFKSIKLDCQHDSCLRPQDFNEQLKEQINLLGDIKNDSSNLQSYLSVVFDQLKEHEKLLDFLRNDSSNLQKDNLVVYDQLKEHRGLLGDLKNDSSSLQEEILKAKGILLTFIWTKNKQILNSPTEPWTDWFCSNWEISAAPPALPVKPSNKVWSDLIFNFPR